DPCPTCPPWPPATRPRSGRRVRAVWAASARSPRGRGPAACCRVCTPPALPPSGRGPRCAAAPPAVRPVRPLRASRERQRPEGWRRAAGFGGRCRSWSVLIFLRRAGRRRDLADADAAEFDLPAVALQADVPLQRLILDGVNRGLVHVL